MVPRIKVAVRYLVVAFGLLFLAAYRAKTTVKLLSKRAKVLMTPKIK